MVQNLKRAWGNVIVWGSYIAASSMYLGINGTVFFWKTDTTRTGFYTITGIAIGIWFIMMLIVSLGRTKSEVIADERDAAIMSRVNAAAGPIAMTAVALIALVLMIMYLKDKNSVISPYFLIYMVITNVVVYWLAQAINTLIAYSRS